MAALAAGCEQPRTELVVRVDSEVAWGAGRTVQSVVLSVRRGGANGPLRSARTTALGTGGERRSLPLYVGVIANDGDTDTPVWIEALGCADPNGCSAAGAVVAQRAVVRFTRGLTEEVPLLLASACVGVTCASDQRCVVGSGRCEAATAAQEMVRPFVGMDASAPVDAPVMDGPMDLGREAAVAMDAPMDAGEVVDSLGAGDVGDMIDGAGDAVAGDVPVDRGASDDHVTPPDVGSARSDGSAECSGGQVECSGTCRSLQDDPANCGACDVSCNDDHALGRCTAGSCVIERCAASHADCDGVASNGCEADVGTSSANCGRCAASCPTGAMCVSGVCGGARAGGIAAGNLHTCAIRSGGRVVCWGYNNAVGALGDGMTANSSTPVNVVGITDAVELSADVYHTCARRAGGSLVCWGQNVYGQLGNGTTANSMTPVPVTGLSDATAISSGTAHVCALRASGEVSCWGLNSSGQIGDGTTVNSAVPTTVSGLMDAVSVTAGSTHTCARRAGGTVVCWGRNSNGQLGDGTVADSRLPVTVSGLSDVVQVTAGVDVTCALRSTGSIVCWGGNESGQLGNGGTTPSRTPVAVSGLSDAVGLVRDFNLYHLCARRAGGAVVCWGGNMRGGLGNGTTRDATTPVPVAGLDDATELTAGIYHTCARRSAGSVFCWGGNMSGQLGDGTMVDRASPVVVVGLP
ncbi:MAG: hypothetical protein Q8S73_26010 [Deltaproteobacteria bacterium]|nr:hypothetical protein [Myxococcales bacterium]MDP3217591.1 hypothetical protein [Deltaproteobacteria bacterium]